MTWQFLEFLCVIFLLRKITCFVEKIPQSRALLGTAILPRQRAPPANRQCAGRANGNSPCASAAIDRYTASLLGFARRAYGNPLSPVYARHRVYVRVASRQQHRQAAQNNAQRGSLRYTRRANARRVALRDRMVGSHALSLPTSLSPQRAAIPIARAQGARGQALSGPFGGP